MAKTILYLGIYASVADIFTRQENNGKKNPVDRVYYYGLSQDRLDNQEFSRIEGKWFDSIKLAHGKKLTDFPQVIDYLERTGNFRYLKHILR